ncbi:hypothetical protein BHYA_0008g00060 [Botrytis hyacinthi]|uniref:Uncharacterized protein n=1 Tax=Botrytis hyacinthi TaxID=278943 RepID=A0A4Z1HBK5_9HELO|nr:hypothetical protein BHYA_0008g00060 [Botrytis hyacinthi]
MSQELTGRKKTSNPTSKPKKVAPTKKKLPEFLDYDHVLGERNLDHAAIERDYFDNKNKASRQASQSKGGDSDSEDRQKFSASKNTIEDSRAKQRKEKEEKERTKRDLTPPSQYYQNDRDPTTRDSVEGMFGLPEDGWGVPRESKRTKKSGGAEEIGGLVGSRDDGQKHGGDEIVPC